MLTLTILLLLACGISYAYLEYVRPIYPTRLAVVIGVGVSMAGQIAMAILLYDEHGLTGVITAICVPFLLTGVPMYVGQELKDRCFADEGNRCRKTTGDLGKLDGDA
jgi:hypothetical protein